MDPTMLPPDPMADPSMDPTMAGMGPTLPPVMDPMVPAQQPIMPPPPVDPMLDPYPNTSMFGAMPVVTVGPTDPDYVPAKKPKAKEYVGIIEDVMSAHEPRLSIAREMADWLDHTNVGSFEIDADDIIDGEVETWPLSMLRDDHEFNNGMIASMDLYFEHASRERIDDEEVLALEDACMWWWLCEQRQHARRLGSVLKRDIPNYLQRTGALVGMDTVDPDNPECGLKMSLIDPLTIFPIFGGDAGLLEVYRVHEMAVADIIGNYASKSEKDQAKLMRIARKTNGGGDYLRMLTVKEIWNRDWFTLVVEEDEIFSRRHGMGFVPFTIVLGGFDLPPGLSGGNMDLWDESTSEPGIHRSLNGDRDLTRHWIPWAWRRTRMHAIKEAIAGRTLTQSRRDMNPPMVYEFDPVTKDQDRAEITTNEKKINRIPLGNKLSVLPTGSAGPTLATMQLFLQQNDQQGLWSLMRAGEVPPQTPAAAMGTMIELGGADRSPITHAIELFHTLRAERRLKIAEEWLPAMGRKGARGSLSIPSQGQGYGYASPIHTLTREMIERAGCYVNCALFAWQPNPAMAQFIATIMGAGLSSPETALRKMRYVPDPLRELQRIEDHQLHQLPAVLNQVTLSRLGKEFQKAWDEGDYETADERMVAIQVLEFEQEQMIAQGMMAPIGGVPAGGAVAGEGQTESGTPPPGPSIPPPPTNGRPLPGMGGTTAGNGLGQQGLVLPPIGVYSGRQGGRPQQTTQTKPMTRNPTVTAPR